MTVRVGQPGAVKRALVRAIAMADGALDEVLYRPAVVKAFAWLPRWWGCELARLSMALDDRWQTSYWRAAGIEPSGACEACGRRAAIHVIGGGGCAGVLAHREVYLCGWCQVRGKIADEEDLAEVLADARRDSVSWRWRWRVRP